jgi:hypothetical protein
LVGGTGVSGGGGGLVGGTGVAGGGAGRVLVGVTLGPGVVVCCDGGMQFPVTLRKTLVNVAER